MPCHFKFKNLLLAIVIVFTVWATSCSPDDPSEPDADLENAKLSDFPLTEADYLDINIIHPELTNDEETKQGEIQITIPHSRQSLVLSLKEHGLDDSKYSISPGIGVQRDFTTTGIVYTITSKINAVKSVHYLVTIVHGGEPFTEQAEITGFKFEASKNPALTATIEALKISSYPSSSEGAIYVIVPVGTDFSNLVPTISFNAAKLYYRTDGEFKTYSANGMPVDFKYPKRVSLQAENSLGVKSKIYQIIVDVKNPIRFEENPLATPLVKTGDGLTSEYFSAIKTWTNQGNHPITGMSPKNYKDKIYPIPGYTGDANVITATLTNPVSGTAGVLPGETGYLNVNVKRASKAGLFSTTAVFIPTFSFNTQTISYWNVDDRIEDLFDSYSLTITSTLEE